MAIKENEGYITYYNLDGTFHSKEILNIENLADVIGTMIRCTMNN